MCVFSITKFVKSCYSGKRKCILTISGKMMPEPQHRRVGFPPGFQWGWRRQEAWGMQTAATRAELSPLGPHRGGHALASRDHRWLTGVELPPPQAVSQLSVLLQ